MALSPADRKFPELRRGSVSQEGSLVKARRGVGHALDHHALLGRITKAAETHRVLLFGLVHLGVLLHSSHYDLFDRLGDDAGSLFNPAGTVAREGQDRPVCHEPVCTHPSAIVHVHEDVLASANWVPSMDKLDTFAGDGDRLVELIWLDFLL